MLWKFDAHIQDVLSATSEMRACAYELGSGPLWSRLRGEGMFNSRRVDGCAMCSDTHQTIGDPPVTAITSAVV